jgi:hypothetical protein
MSLPHRMAAISGVSPSCPVTRVPPVPVSQSKRRREAVRGDTRLRGLRQRARRVRVEPKEHQRVLILSRVIHARDA